MNNQRHEGYVPLLKNYPDSEKINKLSEGAEAMYCRLLARCDDNGNYHGAPKRLLGKLFTLRYENGTMTAIKVRKYRNELAAVGLIACYEVNQVTYIHVNSCKKSLRKDIAKKIFFPEPQGAASTEVAVNGTDCYAPVTDCAENVAPIQTKPNQTKLYSATSVALSELLFKEIQKRKPDLKKPNLQAWAKHIGLMLRIDKRLQGKIANVIHWCQQDEFWQDNILSTLKLRKHYDQLELKMAKGSNPKHQNRKCHRCKAKAGWWKYDDTGQAYFACDEHKTRTMKRI